MTVIPVRLPPAVLLNVTFCVAVSPVLTLPKLRTVGDTLATAVLVPWNSTAPTSIRQLAAFSKPHPVADGRGFPKKSLWTIGFAATNRYGSESAGM